MTVKAETIIRTVILAITLANQILAYNGLNIKIEGDGGHSTGTEYQVVSQSIAPGTLVPEGTVVVVKFEKVSQ